MIITIHNDKKFLRLKAYEMRNEVRMRPHSDFQKRLNLLVFWVCFVFLSLLFGTTLCQVARPAVQFRHLSIEDGISQNSVTCMLQDRYGFMWFGTTDGLNRYDGYSFQTYLHNPNDSTSISHNTIKALYEDEDGLIWIATLNGLNQYNPLTGYFKSYFHDPTQIKSISNDKVQSICEDHLGFLWFGTEGGLNRYDRLSGSFQSYHPEPGNPNSICFDDIMKVFEDSQHNLWIGTFGGGLTVLDSLRTKFTHFKNDPQNAKSLSHNIIRDIIQDSQDIIWVATQHGLNQFDPMRKEFIRYTADGSNQLQSDWIYCVFEDSQNRLWLGTEGGGLYCLNQEDEVFFGYQYDEHNPKSISNNRVTTVYEDQAQNIWIGTWNGGINRIDGHVKQFYHYKRELGSINTLSNSHVNSIFEDHQGIFWIGTFHGLTRWDPKKDIFKSYYHSSDPNSLSSNIISSICEDHQGQLWIATITRGFNRYDPETQRFYRYQHNVENLNNLAYDVIWAMDIDGQGNIWLGTGGAGVDRFDPRTETFTHYSYSPNDSTGLSHNTINTVYVDDSGILWIGTEAGGLNCYNDSTKRFKRYLHDPENPYSISSNKVFSIIQSESGIYWIGTDLGLNRFHSVSNMFEHFTTQDGLCNNVIYGILEDDNGHIWVSTNQGLSEFNPETNTFANYDSKDGLQSNEFNTMSCCRSSSGELLFGGINGFNRFHPDSIKKNPFKPPVVLTDFQISNISFQGPGPLSPLKQTIYTTDQLMLSYHERVFAFEFVALNFICPEKNQYRYMMENFDESWYHVGQRRFVMYTNMPPGQYIFHVQGSNNDGIWSEKGVELHLHITPPFWFTFWFRFLLILIGAGLVITVYRVRTHMIRKTNVQLRDINIQLNEQITERAKAETALTEARDKLEKRVQERTRKLKKANQELMLEIGERKRIESEIERRQKYVESVLYNTPNGIVTTDASGAIIEWNPGAENIFNYSRDEVLGKNIDDFLVPKKYLKKARSMSQKTLSGENVNSYETVRYRKNKYLVNVMVAASPIRNGDEVFGTVGVYTDITDLKNAEKKIKKSLSEKEILLKEIHHRVKNNLQIISSLLNLQTRQIQDEKTKSLFKVSQDRIRSMALIHERLYQSKDLASIDFGEYIKSLSRSLFRAYQSSNQNIDFDIQVDNISLNIDIAVPCGLIVNELVSNSLKHAFPDDWEGKAKITILLRSLNKNKVELVVKDNGIGISDGFELKKTSSLGMKLVMILVEDQLRGTIQMRRENGAQFKIQFQV